MGDDTLVRDQCEDWGQTPGGEPPRVGGVTLRDQWGKEIAMSVTYTPLNHAMAEAIAVMIQAIRMGDTTRARTLGLTALAVYAHDAGDEVSVESLLADADPGETPIPEALRSRVPMLRIHDPAAVDPSMFMDVPPEDPPTVVAVKGD